MKHAGSGPPPVTGPAADGPGRGRPPEPDVPAVKLAQLVAERLVDDIIGRGWPVGQNLGAEPELMARHGVSRAVLREAVRLVEHMGIATMRRGPRGGLIVTSSSVSAVTDAIAIFLEAKGVDLDDILEARIVLELHAARLAADVLDTVGTEALLRVPMEREGPGHPPDPGQADLHLAIARATGNPALALFIDALCRLERRYLDAAGGDGPRRRVHLDVSLAQAHRAIAEAVISGDALLARHRMLAHLESVSRYVRRARAGGDECRRPPAGHARSGADGGAHVVPGVSAVISEGRKLAEVTAGRIRRDIAQRRSPVGTNLGSERALRSAYGVSRSVLREAVRLLEYHSVARMRRGPGGGLIVIEPDAEAVIRAVTLFLRSTEVDVHSLFEARDAIELASVASAVERLDPGAADLLAATLDQEKLRPQGWADLGASNLHGVIAQLAGNRILGLFTQILLHLTAKRLAQLADQRPDWEEQGRRSHEMHLGIVEALLAGDTALARRRMRVHLRALERCSVPAAPAGPGDRPLELSGSQ